MGLDASGRSSRNNDNNNPKLSPQSSRGLSLRLRSHRLRTEELIRRAEVMKKGHDVTVVGWGRQLTIFEKACDMAQSEHGISCELINLRSLSPWDADTVENSVRKTGKLVISHEAPITCGFGAEVVVSIQERCFLSQEAPIKRVCGYDTPFPLVFEKEYLLSEWKNLEAIKHVMDYSK